MEQCYMCGAERWSWMGGAHECMPPTPDSHPYQYFMDPLTLEDDDH